MSIWRIVVILLALAWPGLAQAHLLPKQNATINLNQESAFLVVSVPASALPGADRNGDGLIDAAEIGAGQPKIVSAFSAGLSLTSDKGAGKQIFAWVMPPQPEDPVKGSDYVVILSRYDFPAPPSQLDVDYRLFGTRGDERQVTVKATLKSSPDQPSEVAILTPLQNRHSYFRGAWSQFGDFLGAGIEHILAGWDHLLFLLTILVAARGWRSWLAITAAFTLAHSITLTLAALDLVRLPGTLVEAAIAASIALVAGLNLFPTAGRLNGIKARLAIVFACGLLHGLGFASALGELFGPGGARLAPLVSFNLGIELGQLASAAVLLGLIGLLERSGKERMASQIPRLASVLALVAGSLLLVQRLLEI